MIWFSRCQRKCLWTALCQSLWKHFAVEDVLVLNRCKMTNGNQQQLRQHCCFLSSIPFQANGRSQRSLQLFLIKAGMMIEWGLLKHSSCFSTDGKHEGSVMRQDIIRLPKKTQKWLIRFWHFAGFCRSCSCRGLRETLTPAYVIKMCCNRAMFSGKEKNPSAIGSLPKGQLSKIWFRADTNYKEACNQLKELTGEQRKLSRQPAFRVHHWKCPTRSITALLGSNNDIL